MRVLIKPDVARLPDIYRYLGMDYDGRVLPSLGNEVLKSVIARYTATQLLTEREQISAKIREILRERLKDFMIQVDDVSITELTFGKEYARAIEDKQIAQQEAFKAEYLVQKAEQEKKMTIIKAQGEAIAAANLGVHMSKNPAYLDLKRIEAARNIAHTLAQSRTRVFVESDTLLLNLTQGLNESLEKKTDADLLMDRQKSLVQKQQQKK